jgi:phytanoyl-CoA hydroxylase
MSFLSVQQISDYEKNGYIVIENFWDTSTVSNLKNRIGEIVAGLNLNDEVHSLGFTKSIFTTKEDRRDADDYFLSSGYAIRFFWEENAWVGLHDIDPQFSAVTYESRIGQICRDLGMLKPLAVQSMYIFKQALVGGEVCAHQGKTFWQSFRAFYHPTISFFRRPLFPFVLCRRCISLHGAPKCNWLLVGS